MPCRPPAVPRALRGILVLVAACGGAVGPAVVPEPPPVARDACVVGPAPVELRATWELSPFYEKHVDLRGFPILSSARVSDRALCAARAVVERMLEHRPELLERLVARRIRLAIMAPDEVTTDIPEHGDLRPKEQWDRRARGLAATLARPAVSAGEENVLCLEDDPYRGESILVHELSHTVFELAVEPDEPGAGAALDAAYAAARQAGRFANTYAMENRDEYWAEGAQDWFDTNRTSSPSNGVHNEIGTRVQLVEYDPALAAVLESVFGAGTWRYRCERN